MESKSVDSDQNHNSPESCTCEHVQAHEGHMIAKEHQTTIHMSHAVPSQNIT